MIQGRRETHRQDDWWEKQREVHEKMGAKEG